MFWYVQPIGHQLLIGNFYWARFQPVINHKRMFRIMRQEERHAARPPHRPQERSPPRRQGGRHGLEPALVFRRGLRLPAGTGKPGPELNAPHGLLAVTRVARAMIRPRSVGVIDSLEGRRGADHENDDEGTAFCCAEIGASGQGAVRSWDGGGECSADRATEIAQQCSALPRLIPNATQRRRLARFKKNGDKRTHGLR